jgi:uncharacterized protein (TIGR03083 family)
VDPEDVASSYTEGVDAVVARTAELTSGQWSAPACGSWSAADTMRHLVSVAGWYHDWLDRAIDRDESRPFPGEQIDAYTAAALEERQHLTPAEAVAEFRRSATDYLDRAGEHLDLPYAFPFGTVTVGLHLGVAAAEWHLHAWDLSTTTDRRHRPDDPGELVLAVAECVAATSGRFKGGLVRRVTPFAVRRSPWETLLRRSGRLRDR